MGGMKPAILADLFEAHASRLVLYARQWLERELAEDAVQEVFVNLAGQSGIPREPRPWLFKAVRNAAISELRSRKRRQNREHTAGEGRTGFFEEDESLDAEAAQGALESLPVSAREIVVLRIWGEMTFQEIGQVVGRAASSVFAEYQQALGEMKERLEWLCPRNKK